MFTPPIWTVMATSTCSRPSDDKIAWYENLDGDGTFGPQRVITTGALQVQSIFAADIDGDGDIDVLSADWSA